MIEDATGDLLHQIANGTDFSYLEDKFEEIKSKLDYFAENQFSCSLFISGLPGSGKTYTIRRALKEANIGKLWVCRIDCRLFDTDKSAMKEFLQQTSNPPNRPVLEALKLLGAGIIIFDHFDSMKIIKRQFFLYTLFDSIHTKSVALCVIVVTSSHEPLNNLEKRVKSRFTPVSIDFPSPSNFDMDNFIPLLTSTSSPRMWNDCVKTLFTKHTKSKVIHPFERLYSLSPSLHTAMIFARKLSFFVEQKRLTIIDLENTVNEIINTINPSRFLEGLSHIDLIVVFVSVYMKIIKLNNDFAFDQLFEEIQTQFRPYSILKILTVERIKISWDKLISMKLIVVTSKDGTRVSPTVYEDDIDPFVVYLPTEVQVWSRVWLKKV